MARISVVEIALPGQGMPGTVTCALPGFDGEFAPNPENSLQWLARKIVAEDRFAEASVEFWWPSIMGGEVAGPPEDEGDADFDGLLLTSNAQAAEVTRLARGFRRGFGDGAPYNLRDMLVEIVLSKWFRADWFAGDDPVHAVALRDAGAVRLLTPEELARKTAALTGFQWGRRYNETSPPSEKRLSRLTDRNEYRLLYGGIDSDGITERARDLTSVMAGVAKSHAMESSCPVVLREFYLLPEEDRRLFTAIDTVVSPVWEDVGGTFATTEDWGTVTLDATLTAGEKTVRLWQQYGSILVDEIVVRNAAKAIVDRFEFEQVSETECGQPWPEIEPGYFAFWCGSLAATVDIPATGEYMIEVAVKGEPQGDGAPELTIAVEWGDMSNSKGAVSHQGQTRRVARATPRRGGAPRLAGRRGRLRPLRGRLGTQASSRKMIGFPNVNVPIRLGLPVLRRYPRRCLYPAGKRRRRVLWVRLRQSLEISQRGDQPPRPRWCCPNLGRRTGVPVDGLPLPAPVRRMG